MKKILALLLVFVMVFGLVACVDSNPDDTKGTNGNEETKGPEGPQAITLKVWTPSEDQAEGNSWLGTMEAEFEKAHPEYKITWVNEVCDEGTAKGLVTGDVSAAADLYLFASDQLGTLVTAGGLSKLGGAYADQVKNDNTELAINTVTHTDGAIYGFPMTNNTWYLYYNKDIFTEEDVKSIDAMLAKGKVAFPWGTGWYGGAYFLGNGGTIFGPNGNDEAAGIDFGGQKGYDAAAAMIALANNANMVNDGGVAGVMDGSIGACFTGSWDAAKLKEALGDKLGVTQLPTFQCAGETKQMMSFAATKCVGVNPSTKYAKAATQFASFLASADGQLKRYEMRGVIPCAKSLADNADIAADIVAIAELNTMANTAVVQSSLSGMSNYWNPIETFCKSIINGEINMDNYKDNVDLLNNQLNATGL